MKAPSNISSVYNVDFLLDENPDSENVIDLEPLTFIKPVGIVALLAAIERRRHPGRTFTIRLPSDDRVKTYLRSAHVFDVMRELVTFEGSQPEDSILEGNPVRQMVPCVRFRDENDVEDLAREMVDCFQTELKGYASLQMTCEGTFSELAGNSVAHADSDGGYALAQQYSYRSGPIVEIAVADSGIGIRESLRKNPNLASIGSDVDAIREAIKEGVTSTMDLHRGYGLYWIRQGLKNDDNRTMTIRSGKGIITVRGNGHVVAHERKPYYPGTIVSIVIPCERY